MPRRSITEICSKCKKEFQVSQFSGLSSAIMQEKPLCKECKVPISGLSTREKRFLSGGGIRDRTNIADDVPNWSKTHVTRFLNIWWGTNTKSYNTWFDRANGRGAIMIEMLRDSGSRDFYNKVKNAAFIK